MHSSDSLARTHEVFAEVADTLVEVDGRVLEPANAVTAVGLQEVVVADEEAGARCGESTGSVNS